MVCRSCGHEFPNGKNFCPKCGAKYTDEPIVIQPANTAAPAVLVSQPKVVNKIKNSKKNLFPIACIVIGCFLIFFMIRLIAGGSVHSMEEKINKLSRSKKASPERVISLYEEYDKLSESKKEKVRNADKLLKMYEQASQIVGSVKHEAAQIDQIVLNLNNRSIYAKASYIKEYDHRLSGSDDVLQYSKHADEIEGLRKETKNLNDKVTPENFYELYIIKYFVGEKTNAGYDSLYQVGWDAWIDLDSGYASVSPMYAPDFHSDFYTPVYVQVIPRYPNLTNSCHFYINLHQTYSTLGGETKEFASQTGEIKYESYMGIAEYMIPVEDNNSSGGIADAFGLSLDMGDRVHKLARFDESKVQISGLEGSVKY